MKPRLIALLLAPLAVLHAAELRLPSIFSDHMVLQCAKAVPVWGWANVGEQIVVEFAGKTKSSTANADGKWMVKLDALEASATARELIVKSLTRSSSLKIADVIVGEVWAGGGQSNMEFDMKAITSAAAEIEASANPTLRQFHVLKNPAARAPVDDVQGYWTVARPGTTEDFIAAGYYFAKSIQRELKTPVGLIKVCWGGSKVEPWISPASLASVPELASGAKNMDAMSECNKSAFREWLKRTQREDRTSGDVLRFLGGPVSTDDGWVAVKDSGPVSDPSLPKFGAFWFRKEVSLSARQTGAAQVLQFGPTAQFDRVYWNGTLIGERPVDSFTGLISVRHYLIPPALLKEGVNQLAVRLFAPAEPPGFSWFPSVGTTKMLGGWMAKAEYALPLLDDAGKKAVPPLTGQHVLPGRLFNGMVHPLLPYAIRGVLWYQGESNTGNASLYRTSFPLLIQDWRQHWQQGDFPFYFCQLANYRPKTNQPGESVWAELREAQAKTLSVPNTGMAVLIDTGESEDIHPQTKQIAGERLAKIALAKTYGREVVHSGPVYASMKIEGSAIRLSFDQLGGGLVAKEVPATYDVMRKAGKTAPLVRNSPQSQLEGFAICGADKQWVWAEAKIEGDTVLVSSSQVLTPIAVRYGWADNPTCNLYNQAGLPAPPFRTDDFAFAAASPTPPAKSSTVSSPPQANPPAPLSDKPIAITPTPRTENPGWIKIVERQAVAAKAGHWDLVLIGDSITAGWQSGAPAEIWAKHFPAYRTLNLGIAADKTENVLWRLGFPGTLDGYQPKLFILMIGTNNTGHRFGTETADETAQGVRAILDTLTTKAPGSKVLLLAIFPRGEAIKRQRNDEVNRQIKKLADNQKIFWLDLSQHFLEPDGTLSKRLFMDEKPYPIHLSAEGYEAWAKAMRLKVEELMKK
uniref:GDSL-type esterase/lipase family protein n=1 Tax=Prosthecobacter sp. TaxID=1965333 RepID=UPI003783841A